MSASCGPSSASSSTSLDNDGASSAPRLVAPVTPSTELSTGMAGQSEIDSSDQLPNSVPGAVTNSQTTVEPAVEAAVLDGGAADKIQKTRDAPGRK